MLKPFLLALILVFSVACGNTTKMVSDSSLEEPPAPEAAIDPQEILVLQFVKSIQTKDVDGMSEYYPDMNSTRVMMGEKALRYTNKQIQDDLLQPMIDRFENNMEKIFAAMKSKGVNADELSYQSMAAGPVDNPYTTPTGIEIFLDLNGKSVTIPISVIKYKNQWKVLEILMTSNLF